MPYLNEVLYWYVDITIDEANIDSNLTDKTLTVVLDSLGATFWDNISTLGTELRAVLGSDGVTRLPLKIVAIDTGAETGVVKIKVPTTSSGAGTVVRLYYGADNVCTALADATYGSESSVDGNHVIAMDLEESGAGVTDEYVDTTSNGNHGTGGGGDSGKTPDQITGQVANAQQFVDGNDDYIDIADAANNRITSTITMCALVKRDSGKGGMIFIKSDSGGSIGQKSYGMQLDTSGHVLIILTPVDAGGFFTSAATIDTDWHHLAVTWDGTTSGSGNVILYIDGVESETFDKTTALHTGAGNPVTIGAITTGSLAPFDGAIDDLILLDAVWSAAEIKADSINKLTPLTYYSFGAPVQSVLPAGGTITRVSAT